MSKEIINNDNELGKGRKTFLFEYQIINGASVVVIYNFFSHND